MKCFVSATTLAMGAVLLTPTPAAAKTCGWERSDATGRCSKLETNRERESCYRRATKEYENCREAERRKDRNSRKPGKVKPEG